MKRLLIATTNPGKLLEFRELLGDLPVELVLPERDLQVAETGSSYAENAALKARAYAAASGLLTLADDSGLEVAALGGAPGLYSARYSPLPGANDADRRAHLLANLRGLPQPWTAHFHCTVAVALPGGEIHFADGQVYGEILLEERGSNGFGYDPLFLLPELGRTMAELTREEKNTLSHRARAVHAALPELKMLLGV
ncbi:RdgB/HAM1 family non-canonical purine NTP pyrophosphatase [bacterium]|nr:MAG: RdgB/HAM1 family non-canonical purine NTP pyrophosphatase [bacterium]